MDSPPGHSGPQQIGFELQSRLSLSLETGPSLGGSVPLLFLLIPLLVLRPTLIESHG